MTVWTGTIFKMMLNLSFVFFLVIHTLQEADMQCLIPLSSYQADWWFQFSAPLPFSLSKVNWLPGLLSPANGETYYSNWLAKTITVIITCFSDARKSIDVMKLNFTTKHVSHVDIFREYHPMEPWWIAHSKVGSHIVSWFNLPLEVSEFETC